MYGLKLYDPTKKSMEFGLTESKGSLILLYIISGASTFMIKFGSA